MAQGLQSVSSRQKLGHKIFRFLRSCRILKVPHDVRLLLPDCVRLFQLELPLCNQHIHHTYVRHIFVSGEKFFQLDSTCKQGSMLDGERKGGKRATRRAWMLAERHRLVLVSPRCFSFRYIYLSFIHSRCCSPYSGHRKPPSAA